jgi:hypothetical protein
MFKKNSWVTGLIIISIVIGIITGGLAAFAQTESAQTFAMAESGEEKGELDGFATEGQREPGEANIMGVTSLVKNLLITAVLVGIVAYFLPWLNRITRPLWQRLFSTAPTG